MPENAKHIKCIYRDSVLQRIAVKRHLDGSKAVRISHTTTHIIHMNDKRCTQMQARVQTMMCVIFFQMSNYFVNKKDERTEQQSGGIT